MRTILNGAENVKANSNLSPQCEFSLSFHDRLLPSEISVASN